MEDLLLIKIMAYIAVVSAACMFVVAIRGGKEP